MWVKTRTSFINMDNVSRLWYDDDDYDHGTWVDCSDGGVNQLSEEDVTETIMGAIMRNQTYVEVQ